MNRPLAAPLPGLAPRSIRLAAVFVDTLFALPLILLWGVAGVGSFGLSLGALAGHVQERPWLSRAGTLLVGSAAWVVFAAASVALGCLVLYQWFLLSTRGQTIGKRLVGIRIVDLEGQPAGFFSALLLRSWVFPGVMSLVVSFSSVLIPFAGIVFWLLDYVPLFGEDRRCLHDYLAGTQVRWVRVVEVYVGRLVGAVLAVAVVGGSVAAVLNREALVPMIQSLAQPTSKPAPAPVVVAAPAVDPVTPPSAVEPIVPPSAVEPTATAPTAPAAEKAEPEAEKRLYQFTDDQGVLHVTDDLNAVPQKFRAKVIAP